MLYIVRLKVRDGRTILHTLWHTLGKHYRSVSETPRPPANTHVICTPRQAYEHPWLDGVLGEHPRGKYLRGRYRPASRGGPRRQTDPPWSYNTASGRRPSRSQLCDWKGRMPSQSGALVYGPSQNRVFWGGVGDVSTNCVLTPLHTD